jgi:hypothetical protein
VRDGVLAANPADAAMLPKLHPELAEELGDEPEVNAWTAAELRAFLAATEGHPRHPLWVTAAATWSCAGTWSAAGSARTRD